MYTLCSKLQVGIVVKVIVVEIVEFVTGMPFSGKSLNSGPDHFKFQAQRSNSLHKSGTVTQFSGPRVVACWPCCKYDSNTLGTTLLP